MLISAQFRQLHQADHALWEPLPLNLDMLGKAQEGMRNTAIKLGLNAPDISLAASASAVGGLKSSETSRVFSTAVPKLMEQAVGSNCLHPAPCSPGWKAAQTSRCPWTKEPPSWVPGACRGSSVDALRFTNRACRFPLQKDRAAGAQSSEMWPK